MAKNYEVKITGASRELTAKEKIMLKDTNDCVSLDVETREHGFVIIDLHLYAFLDVHNEASEDKDYRQLILIDNTGIKYVTGSKPLMEKFETMTDDIADMDESNTPWQLKVFRKPSRQRQGVEFMTCTII